MISPGIGTTIRAITGPITAGTTPTAPPRSAPLRVRPELLLFLIVALTLAAFGGAYAWIAAPLAIACGALALVVRPPVLSRSTIWIDAGLLVAIGGIAAQVVPLPAGLAESLSPVRSATARALLLGEAASSGAAPLSIHPAATRTALLMAIAAVLTFFSAREIFARGGLRRFARLLTAASIALSLLAIAQRTTSPYRIYWWWTPLDEGARPFGPFVNRNHLAAWLLMALGVIAGYLAAHVVTRLPELQRLRWPRRIRAAAGGIAALLIAALLVTMLTLLATLSRSALLGLSVAAMACLWLARRRAAAGALRVIGAGSIAVLLLLGLQLRGDDVRQRLAQSFEDPHGGRAAIWQDTWNVIAQFPLTGTGAGTYASAMVVHQRADRSVFFNQAHNEYLQLAAEGGLLVTLPLAWAAVAYLLLLRARLEADRSPLFWVRAGAATALAAVAIQSVWETPLRMGANLVLAAALAGIALHAPARAPGAPSASG